MTRNKQQKLAARNRAAETGEPYVEALRHMRGGSGDPLSASGQQQADDREFVALCGACGGDVPPGTGTIWLGAMDLQSARDAFERRVRDRIDRSRELEALGSEHSIEDWLRLAEIKSPEAPWPASWQVHHRDCWNELDIYETRMRTIDSGFMPAYWIGTERLRTYADVAWWSAHFGRKNFFDTTDWSLVINEAHGEVFDRDWEAKPRRLRPVRLGRLP